MRESERRELKIAASVAGDCVEVQVADTGCGLSPEVRRKLFTPFTSTKEDGMGTGLSISRTIVEAHQGRIWAEDAKSGTGTRFHFTLPLAEADEAS